jgi:protein-disulfide isomerase
MGGASRYEKRRKQARADARLAAAGIKAPKRSGLTIVLVAIVAVAAVLVGVGVYFARASRDVEPTYTATASGAVVTAGTGPVVVDVYEDFICPVCERFEQRYGSELTTALNEGKVTAKFHTIAILDDKSSPAGYSSRAANAALCAVPAGIYPQYHKKLFAEQPAEGSAGLSDDQLVAFGTDLGAKGDFAGCVRKGTNNAAVKSETATAVKSPGLQTNGTFGTPTVARDGKKIDISDPSWLKNAIAGK